MDFFGVDVIFSGAAAFQRELPDGTSRDFFWFFEFTIEPLFNHGKTRRQMVRICHLGELLMTILELLQILAMAIRNASETNVM
jgi:hypothetical protein